LPFKGLLCLLVASSAAAAWPTHSQAGDGLTPALTRNLVLPISRAGTELVLTIEADADCTLSGKVFVGNRRLRGPGPLGQSPRTRHDTDPGKLLLQTAARVPYCAGG
jgi:hypothetical protein